MHELILRLWRETGMTIFMVTHDIEEAFKLGTRVLAFDKLRRDPQAPDAYGATITYDLHGLQPQASVPAAMGHPPRAPAPAGRLTRRQPGRAAAAPPPDLREAQQPGLEGDRGRGQAVRQEGWRKEQQWALDMGLPGAESLTDRSIPTFARGELPHFAGINTFLKAPYVENVRDVGKYDAAVLGIPFDSGTTYRPGTRFGPQGIRRISALYTPYNYELGVDLREQMTLCDAGDVFTIPANLEKSFDQITRGVAHVASSGRPAADAGRRPLDRLSLRARHRAVHVEEDRHRPFRPPHRHPGEGPGRADAHHALVLGDQPAERAARRTWSRSASAAGRCRATA